MIKKNVRKYLSLTLLLAIVVGVLPVNNADADSPLDIKVQLDSEPMIDVVLTMGETNLDGRNFEADLKSSLNSKGVNTSKVKVSAIETKEVEANESNASQVLGDWKSFAINGSNSRPDDFYISGDRIVKSNNGNTRPASGYYDPSPESKKVKDATYEFKWGIHPSQYGSFSHGEAGFIFRMKDEKNYYAYLNDNHSACGNIRIDGGEAIVKVVNGSFTILDQNTFPRYHPGQVEDMKVVTEGNNIKVYRNGQLRLNVNDSTYSEGTHGFYVWDQYGAYFSNINYSTEITKDFSEVIRQPSWRDGSERYLVNFENNKIADFDRPAPLGEILTRLINEGIHYLGVGSGTNQSQALDFINRNNGNGAFYSSSNYNTAINNLATYIKNRIPPADSGTGDKYVVMGEPFKLTVSPSSLLHNTQNAEYPLGRWRVDHEYDYYDNDLGQADWANQWQKDLILDLDKPGKYELFFGTQNPEPRYIYVHRRPIADFNLSVARTGSTYNIAVRDTSYDPDKEYSSNKGIVNHEWKWKKTTDNNWTNGQVPKSLPVGNNYIVQLRVKDEQGEWSIPEARFITTDNVTVPPVASFTASPNPVSMYETLNVNDNSYDPAGKTLNAKEWKVVKDGREVYSASTPLTNFRSLGEGIYQIRLRVRNDAEIWSETYSRTLRVTGDTVAPSALVTPVRMDATRNDVSVAIKYSDTGGSGFKHQRYALTASPTAPTSGWSSWDASTNRSVLINTEGRHYLHLEALDNANNKYTRTAGDYLIDRTPPTLKITQDSLAISHEDTSMLIDAKDSLSGIKEVTYTSNTGDKGAVVNNKVTVRQNGTYTFVAEDNAGNKTTTVYKVENLDKTISFKAPVVKNFSEIEIRDKPTKVSTTLGDLLVSDWRDDNNYWRIDVSATQFSNANNSTVLPKGSLLMKPYIKVDRAGEQITKGNFTKELTIDDGVRTVVDSRNSRGKYNVTFPTDALSLVIDPTISKAGQLTSMITWNLVIAP